MKKEEEPYIDIAILNASTLLQLYLRFTASRFWISTLHLQLHIFFDAITLSSNAILLSHFNIHLDNTALSLTKGFLISYGF